MPKIGAQPPERFQLPSSAWFVSILSNAQKASASRTRRVELGVAGLAVELAEQLRGQERVDVGAELALDLRALNGCLSARPCGSLRSTWRSTNSSPLRTCLA